MPDNDSSTLDDVQILVSPTEAEFPVDGVELRAWAGSILDDNWKVKGECVLLVHRVLTLGEGVPGLEDRTGDGDLVAQVVDAIRATADYPWPPGGPPREEGDEFLGYFAGDNWREIYREVDGSFRFPDGRSIHTPPTHYRHLPSPPRPVPTT